VGRVANRAGFRMAQLSIHVPGDRYPQAPETVQAVAQFWTRLGVKTKVEVVPWSVTSCSPQGRTLYLGTGGIARGLKPIEQPQKQSQLLQVPGAAARSHRIRSPGARRAGLFARSPRDTQPQL
jgi:hypothetical protein